VTFRIFSFDFRSLAGVAIVVGSLVLVLAVAANIASCAKVTCKFTDIRFGLALGTRKMDFSQNPVALSLNCSFPGKEVGISLV